MRYDDEREMLIATPMVLAGAAAMLDLQRGPLSTTLFEIGGPEQARAFEDGLVRLSDSQRGIFETALPIVCDPVRSAMLHMRSAGLVVKRFLAWDADGTIAVVEQLGGEIGLRVVDAEQIKADMLSLLGAGVPFSGSDTRLTLDAGDALVLVATADAFRREWLGSLLDHTPARTALAASDVGDVFAASTGNDLRWTSCLLDGVLPVGLREPMAETATDHALQRLAEAEVLSVIEGEGSAPALYSPTEEAAAVFEGIAGATGALALTIYGMTDEGPGYETTLLARDATTVWTVMLSPVESFVASASPSALVALVEAALGIAS